jgi:hypothetical protein
MIQAKQKPLQTAFVYGFVTGVALGIGEIALGLSLFFIPYPLAALVGRGALILLILAYLYAGYGAARRTGNVVAGTLAGAFTGAFLVATLVVFSFISSFLNTGLFFNSQGLLGIPVALPGLSPVLSPLTRVMLTFAFYGAIAGTVGGLIGKRRSLH